MKKNKKFEILDIATIIIVGLFLVFLLFLKFNGQKETIKVADQEKINFEKDLIEQKKDQLTTQVATSENKLKIIPASFSADLKPIPKKHLFNSSYLEEEIEISGIPYQMSLDLSDQNSFLNKQMIVVSAIENNSFFVENNLGIYQIAQIKNNKDGALFMISKVQKSNQENLSNVRSDQATKLNYFKLENEIENTTPLYQETKIELEELSNLIEIGNFIEIEINCEDLCQEKNYLDNEKSFKLNKINIYEKNIN
ncbi:MAG: hypothetical protein ACOCUT_03335 [bacterium]